jgi:hypothetical protein
MLRNSINLFLFSFLQINIISSWLLTYQFIFCYVQYVYDRIIYLQKMYCKSRYYEIFKCQIHHRSVVSSSVHLPHSFRLDTDQGQDNFFLIQVHNLCHCFFSHDNDKLFLGMHSLHLLYHFLRILKSGKTFLVQCSI